MSSSLTTIRVESELRDRLKKEAQKNETYSEFISKLLDFKETIDMNDRKKRSEVSTPHFQKTSPGGLAFNGY